MANKTTTTVGAALRTVDEARLLVPDEVYVQLLEMIRMRTPSRPNDIWRQSQRVLDFLRLMHPELGPAKTHRLVGLVIEGHEQEMLNRGLGLFGLVGLDRERPVSFEVSKTSDSDSVESIAFSKDTPWLSAGLYAGIGLSSDSLDDAEVLESALERFLDELGYHSVPATQWRRGSWWRRYFRKLKDGVSSDEAKARARVAENVVFGKQYTGIAAGLTKATTDLMEALKNQKGNVVIDAGSFLLIRRAREDGGADVFVKQLTVEERVFLDSDPSRVSRPDELLEVIKDLKAVNLDQLAKEGGTPKYTEDKRPEKRLPPPGPEDQDLAG